VSLVDALQESRKQHLAGPHQLGARLDFGNSQPARFAARCGVKPGLPSAARSIVLASMLLPSR
jgi:hypothetical protein